MNKTDEKPHFRRTKTVLFDGYIYTLVKLTQVEIKEREYTPSFMNNIGWVLHSISHERRKIKPFKRTK